MNVIEVNFGNKETNKDKIEEAVKEFSRLFILVFGVDVEGDREKEDIILQSNFDLRNFVEVNILDGDRKTIEDLRREEVDVEAVLREKTGKLGAGNETLNFLSSLERATSFLAHTHEELKEK